MKIDAFVTKWEASGSAERANKDSFLNDLCDVLGVARPNPTTGDAARDTYVFEKDAVIVHEGGKRTVGRIDLYKHGCFVLEAKQGANKGAKKLGTAKRGTAGWTQAMLDAFGQALGYARTMDTPPPFIVVTDIGSCFDLYACFDGTCLYRPFPNAQQNRVHLSELASNAAHLVTLRAIFKNPMALDPSRKSVKITREVAARLGELAKALHHDGHKPEKVARFLMRCIFTMFAEDVGLLPERTFTNALAKRWIDDPKSFHGELEIIWRAMNDGGVVPFIGKLRTFNGGLFRDQKAIALDARQLKLLHDAASCEWSDVEPAIFGTLIEHALDPKERHKLGAHYTPRAYVERLVRPTIDEPMRAEWDGVRAEVRRLIGADFEKPTAQGKTSSKVLAARKVVKEFHARLCATRVLDPACGSGNFLYVAMELLKRVESEVLALLVQLGGATAVLDLEGATVTPAQFLGIEKKRWAKEVAELVLWIGFLQWHARTRRNKDGKVLWPEPVLQDLHNIECRDAVLAWDGEVPVLDGAGKPVTRWDGETVRKEPTTGADVPDESAKVAMMKLVNPRRAKWPKAEFIVGNPPFLGNKRMRLVLDDGYVDALRGAYRDVPEAVDLVMYWWHRAAEEVGAKRATRFGFVTTNSITQAFNRKVLAGAMEKYKTLKIVFAIPDHPWVDATDGAQVRIAMTCATLGGSRGSLLSVVSETEGDGDERSVRFEVRSGEVHSDLTCGVDLSSTVRLSSNRGLSCPGVQLSGQGFVLSPEERGALAPQTRQALVRRYVTGRDLMQQRREQYVIDTFGLSESDVRQGYPDAYQHLLVRVKPERDQNPREKYRREWWLHSEPRSRFRRALSGLRRFVATSRTTRHRTFEFLAGDTLAETKVLVFAFDDAFHLGVLSSRVHIVFATATGGWLGVGNDSTYNHSDCFDPFPFPDASETQRARVRAIAEELDAHRKARQLTHPTLTMTGMYNVLEKLRTGEALTENDRTIHGEGLVSMLLELHRSLDAAVFDAYGWPATLTDEEILDRVVKLNAARATEEALGGVRWLRPEFQKLTGTVSIQPALPGSDSEEPAAVMALEAWPTTMTQQLAAVIARIRHLGGTATVANIAAGFKGAGVVLIGEALDALESLGHAVAFVDGKVTRWKALGAEA